MKIVIMMLLFMVVGCGQESSPEGRSKIRDKNLQEQLDSLKLQNEEIRKYIIRLIQKELNLKNK